jgi:dTDP-glucose 4,6-dehydratase
MPVKNPLSQDLDLILAHTRALWEPLRGKRLFLTGGTGFFGCWILESFLWANQKLGLKASVTVLTRQPGLFKKKAPHLAAHPHVELYSGDVRNFKFPSKQFSFVIHAATQASASLNRENPLLMFETITQGTRHALDFSVKCGAETFLLTSSGAVYGRQPQDLPRIPENYPGACDVSTPLSAYAEGKRASELLCAIYSKKYGIETKIARGFAFVGPYLPMSEHFAVGNFIQNGLDKEPIVVQGDGRVLRSYLYAADLMIWLWTIFFRGEANSPYNVGSEKAVSIKDLARIVARLTGSRRGVRLSQKPVSKTPPQRYIPDTSKARREFGLKPLISLEQGIERTIHWHRRCYGK